MIKKAPVTTPTLIQRARNWLTAKPVAVKPSAWVQFPYEATGWTREREYWFQTNVAVKEEQSLTNRQSLASQAQRLYRNSSVVKHGVDLMADYAVGTGWRVSSGVDDPNIAEQHENYFNDWCTAFADIRGVTNFDGLLKVTSRAVIVDGDAGWIFARDGAGNPRLQGVHADRIADDAKRTDTTREGVLLDKVGRPIAYRIRQDDGTYQDIPAASFRHIFSVKHYDDLRGVSWLHSAINTVRDEKEVIENETMAVKNLSSWSIIEKKFNPTATLNPLVDTPMSQVQHGAPPIVQTLPGGVKVIQVGEDFQTFNPNGTRPSPAFMGLLTWLLNDLAMSLGLPVEFILDPSKLGGATAKFVVDKVQTAISNHQALLARHADEVYKWVVADGIKRNRIPAAYGFWRHTWNFPAEVSVNSRDQANDLNALRAGASNLADIYARNGRGWKPELEQKAREAAFIKTLATKYGVTTASIQMLTPNGNDPAAQQDNARNGGYATATGGAL